MFATNNMLSVAFELYPLVKSTTSKLERTIRHRHTDLCNEPPESRWVSMLTAPKNCCSKPMRKFHVSHSVEKTATKSLKSHDTTVLRGCLGTEFSHGNAMGGGVDHQVHDNGSGIAVLDPGPSCSAVACKHCIDSFSGPLSISGDLALTAKAPMQTKCRRESTHGNASEELFGLHLLLLCRARYCLERRQVCRYIYSVAIGDVERVLRTFIPD